MRAWTRGELDQWLGAATFEQRTRRVNRPIETIVHWNCGCAALSAIPDRTLQWTPCEFHSEAVLSASRFPDGVMTPPR